MDKENFEIELSKELENLSISEIKDLIKELIDILPANYYEYIICKIKNFKGEKIKLDDDTLNEYNKILDDYKKIEDGEICFQSYSYETGTYSYYDADVDYVYYPSSELEFVLDNTYDLIRKLILYKEYSKVITLFEAIINTSYTCEEVGNPEYDDSDLVYDTYEVSFNNIKNDLGINLDEACLYAIYSLIMCNKPDIFEKIWNYIEICHNVDIRDVLNVGIEKINNFDEFYNKWLNYIEEKKIK